MKIVNKIRRNIEKRVQRITGSHPRFHPQYSADGFGVYGKNLGFMGEARFAAAWEEVRLFNKPYWPSVPDVRWRAHTCIWAAQNGLKLRGNFVELGVNTGLLSSMIVKGLDFAGHRDRRFFLCDTFTGIPGSGLSAEEKANIERLNAAHFTRDVFEVAQRAFADVPNAVFVRGRLPDSLSGVETGPIAYLSVDLNSAAAEIASVTELWPRVVPGAVIVLDDYAFEGHEEQFEAWNRFARERGNAVLTLPTGQGLIIR
jgi:O-methyltransferase